MQAIFLNVDLELESASNLDLIATEMGNRVLVLHSGKLPNPKRNFLALEAARSYKSPDTTIHALGAIVESLSPAAKGIWDLARKRFDVGFESPPHEKLSRFALRPATLERIARLGASLAVTYYRRDEPATQPRGVRNGR